MPIRKSPTMTLALLESNRRNALKSTGPRTRSGKARSRMNGLRRGNRSVTYRRLERAIYWAPSGELGRVVRELLPSETLEHPTLATLAWAHGAGCDPGPRTRRLFEEFEKSRRQNKAYDN